MLVVPFAHDQPDNAARVRRLGIGLGLHRTRYTAERALALLARLLQDVEIKAQAEAIGRRVRGENGLERACEVVEAVLAAGNLNLVGDGR